MTLNDTYIHKYIIGHYNPLVGITTYHPTPLTLCALVLSIVDHYNPLNRITTYLLTPLMLCALIVYMSGRTCSLKSTPNGRFVSNFMAILFYSQNFYQKSAERRSRRRKKIFFFTNSFWCLTWGLNHSHTSDTPPTRLRRLMYCIELCFISSLIQIVLNVLVSNFLSFKATTIVPKLSWVPAKLLLYKQLMAPRKIYWNITRN